MMLIDMIKEGSQMVNVPSYQAHSSQPSVFVSEQIASFNTPFTLFTHGGMLMDLQELLGREVDLVEEGSLRPYAAETANRDKILIYERKSEVERYLAETDWDEWASLPDEFDDANKEDIVKASRSMKADGMPVEQIAKYTGLTAEEIETL